MEEEEEEEEDGTNRKNFASLARSKDLKVNFAALPVYSLILKNFYLSLGLARRCLTRLGHELADPIR